MEFSSFLSKTKEHFNNNIKATNDLFVTEKTEEEKKPWEEEELIDIPEELRTDDVKERIKIHCSNRKILLTHQKINDLEKTLETLIEHETNRGVEITELQEMMKELKTGSLQFKKESKEKKFALFKQNLMNNIWKVIGITIICLIIILLFIKAFR